MVRKSILPEAWQVPEDLRSRLGINVGRQRPMVAEGHLVLVLHSPPQSQNPTRVGRFFWRSPDGIWKSNEPGDGLTALNQLLDEYDECIQSLDQQEHESNTANAYFEVIEQLTPIYRAAQNLYHVLQEARKKCPDCNDLINVRDRAYAIERTAELLFSGTKNSLDSIVAKQAESQALASHQMAIAAHRLNVLAAFFFPIITLTAILGVDVSNVAGVFGIDLQSEWAKRLVPFVFVAIVFTGFLAGAILTRIVVRSKLNAHHRA